MVIKNLLLALEAGLGHGETCIFPIVIFKVKEGVNYNPEDKNYDLLQLSYRVTAKRLFPNYIFLDSPFNLQYYKPGHPETEVAQMGCRTRVMGNVYDPENEIAYGRGNLSFTTINLPMLALEANGDEDKFFELLYKYMDISKKQLLERFEIQARRKVKNMPFLMGEGVWIGSDKLGPEDEIREVIKHGSLSIGFVGLAETLVALYGHHHGEGEEYWNKGYSIVKLMREYCDKASEDTGLNFGLLATPAESYAGKALRQCKAKYGEIKGVTDREYFTNSNHIPVYFNISAADKIRLEAPFHDLCNGGHICYVELDGDTSRNVQSIEAIVKCMHDNNIGYGSINHPVDRDPVCGYTGVINDECPYCHRKETEDKPFERIRRITG
jgi:ribonucleoside-triphosphate reductase